MNFALKMMKPVFKIMNLIRTGEAADGVWSHPS